MNIELLRAWTGCYANFTELFFFNVQSASLYAWFFVNFQPFTYVIRRMKCYNALLYKIQSSLNQAPLILFLALHSWCPQYFFSLVKDKIFLLHIVYYMAFATLVIRCINITRSLSTSAFLVVWCFKLVTFTKHFLAIKPTKANAVLFVWMNFEEFHFNNMSCINQNDLYYEYLAISWKNLFREKRCRGRRILPVNFAMVRFAVSMFLQACRASILSVSHQPTTLMLPWSKIAKVLLRLWATL